MRHVARNRNDPIFRRLVVRKLRQKLLATKRQKLLRVWWPLLTNEAFEPNFFRSDQSKHQVLLVLLVLVLINIRPEGYGSRFVILSVNRATESSAHFFAPVKVRTG